MGKKLAILVILMISWAVVSDRAGAQQVEPIQWVVDQQLDYELVVRTETSIGEEREILEQTYSLQFVVVHVESDGSCVITGHVGRLATRRMIGSAETRFAVVLAQDGETTIEPEGLGEQWVELGDVIVRSVILVRLDAEGSIVQLAGLEALRQAASGIDSASVLLGALSPERLPGLISPIFDLDGAAQHSEPTWETSRRNGLGEGRVIERHVSWRVGESDDGVVALDGELGMELLQSKNRAELSPTGTVESYAGNVRTLIDTFLVEREATEQMTLVWRVDTLESRVESSTTRTLRRLEGVERLPKLPGIGGRAETLRPGGG
jgi:hypothetical protein